MGRLRARAESPSDGRRRRNATDIRYLTPLQQLCIAPPRAKRPSASVPSITLLPKTGTGVLSGPPSIRRTIDELTRKWASVAGLLSSPKYFRLTGKTESFRNGMPPVAAHPNHQDS